MLVCCAREIDFCSFAMLMAAQNEASICVPSAPTAARNTPRKAEISSVTRYFFYIAGRRPPDLVAGSFAFHFHADCILQFSDQFPGRKTRSER
jgi:hypothetical protein